VLPSYVPTGARPYGRPWQRVHRRSAQRVSWTTWLLIGLAVGGFLLIMLVGSLYYWLELSPTPVSSNDYAATAVYKLTATRQAIEAQHDSALTTAPTLSLRTPTPTVSATSIPTNTPSRLHASLTVEHTPVP